MDIIEVNKPDPAKKTICLLAEGTYPYITGGVSSWIQDIISGLKNYNFIIYSIVADEENKIKYKLPENLVRIETRILKDKSNNKNNKFDKEFFTKIKDMHQDMMHDKDFSKLKDIAHGMFKHKFNEDSLMKNIESWEMIKNFNKQRNPLYAFSDYYWAWQSSHNYIIKILSWDIPEADLYHTISTGYAGLVSALAKIRLNKPVILTEHGLYNKERDIDIKRAAFIKGYQRDLWIKVFDDLAKITYDYADLVISLFEHNRKIQVSQGASKEKTMVIPNGIEVDRFLDLKKEDREDFSIGFIGRVVPIKDVKNFIIACKIVAETIDNVKFYIIGPQDEDENYNDECNQLVKNFKLEDKIIFTGKADVREYYSFIDVLVLSSIREAQPLVIIEAYCAGIPVVSTRVGNVPEMLDHDEALLADPKDSGKLAAGIIKLYVDDKYREKLVKENREKALKIYSKKDLIRKYDKIYSENIRRYED